MYVLKGGYVAQQGSCKPPAYAIDLVIYSIDIVVE